MLEGINRIFNFSRDGGDIDPLVICILLLDFFGVVVAEVVAFDKVKAFDEVEVEDFDEVEVEDFDVADDVKAFDTFFGAAVFLVVVNAAADKKS